MLIPYLRVDKLSNWQWSRLSKNMDLLHSSGEKLVLKVLININQNFPLINCFIPATQVPAPLSTRGGIHPHTAPSVPPVVTKALPLSGSWHCVFSSWQSSAPFVEQEKPKKKD